MITYELLKKFCSQFKDSHRPYLKEPFAFSGKVYATNGHVLIRVEQTAGLRYRPDGKDYAEPHSTNMKLDLERGRKLNMAEGSDRLIAENPPGEFIAIPEWDRSVEDERQCHECEGHGYKIARKRNGTRNDEIEVGCDGCDDMGMVRNPNPIEIAVVEQSKLCVDSYYLRLIEALPNPQISIPQRKESAVPFRFDGGVGLLMPMRT